MSVYPKLDKVAISVKAHKVLGQFLRENPVLEEIIKRSASEAEAITGVREWVMAELERRPDACRFYRNEARGHQAFTRLEWKDYAIIRILDYIDHAGETYADPNLRGKMAVSNPFRMLWLAIHHGTGGAKASFFRDMLYLFRQFRGEYTIQIPPQEKIREWTDRHPSGLEPGIIALQHENRDRIIRILADRLDRGLITSTRFLFTPGMTPDEKYRMMREWWDDYRFHLRFAVRSPDLLNELLDHSLDPDTMQILYEARDAGIPFFVNPYYLSLLHVRVPGFAAGADLAIRSYILYSKQLVREFGHITAWEKEDIVEPGKPNAAGWILPTHTSVHRRYPEVAIFIPATMGRACGGLCASCQRMYDFQRGNLNFNLDNLKPSENWEKRLTKIMEYWEKDTQLRDILITGGDALMSQDKSLAKILEAVYNMALRKKQANETRAEGEKYAEIVRIRLGTRLPAYLPQRVTPELAAILAAFREKASAIGLRQFYIQTHFESPLEVTPEARNCIRMLTAAGWTVTNQHVFTAASSRRGHTNKLRQILNDIGVLTYYTFTVKGFMENTFNFATIARAAQEQIEEKYIGRVPASLLEEVRALPDHATHMTEKINALRKRTGLPFLATDRSVINLPGVGKSMTFRVIGITRYGRRIFQFEYDATRTHSPIIHKMGKVIIIESKSVFEYLRQLETFGEETTEYESIWGYSMGETEPRMPIYDYPNYDFTITEKMTHLDLGG